MCYFLAVCKCKNVHMQKSTSVRHVISLEVTSCKQIHGCKIIVWILLDNHDVISMRLYDIGVIRQVGDRLS